MPVAKAEAFPKRPLIAVSKGCGARSGDDLNGGKSKGKGKKAPAWSSKAHLREGKAKGKEKGYGKMAPMRLGMPYLPTYLHTAEV